MQRLTVLFDPTCALCVRCRDWLSRQRAYVPMEFLPCDSPRARARYGAVPWLGQELVVVADTGEVWAGAAAFLVALWALREYREWSYRLSAPALAPLAERFFHAISSRRHALAALLVRDECDSGVCRAPERHRARTAYR